MFNLKSCNTIFLNKRNSLILLCIIIIGALLRVSSLGKQSFWLDEAREFSRANKSVYELWQGQISESNPPLYDVFLHFYLKFSHAKEEGGIRLFSAILGIALIPLAYFVGKHIFSKKVGLYFAFLIAISPFHIYYSQDAKMYSLVALLSLGSFFAYYLCFYRTKPAYWIFYVITTTLLIYTHNYGVLFYLGQIIIFFIFFKKIRNRAKGFLLNNLLIMVFIIPRIICLPRQFFLDYNPWIQPVRLENIFKMLSNFILLAPGTQLDLPLILAQLFATLIFFAALIFAFIFAKGNGNRLEAGQAAIPDKLKFIACNFFIPLAIALLISIKKPVYVAGRYDMIVFPLFCLLVAQGLSSIKNDNLKIFLIKAIAVFTAVSLYNYYFIFYKSNDREVSVFIMSKAVGGDVLIFTDLSDSAYNFYRKVSSPAALIEFPERKLGWLPRPAFQDKPSYISNEIIKINNKINDLLVKKSKIWLMCTSLNLNNFLLAELKGRYPLLEKVDFPVGATSNQISSIYIFNAAR